MMRGKRELSSPGPVVGIQLEIVLEALQEKKHEGEDKSVKKEEEIR
jgi:hypothetical protein